MSASTSSGTNDEKREKSPILFWRYYLPGPQQRGFEWAEIVLTSNGMFATVSDYGNYAYAWRDTGCADFRDFIVQIHADYLCSKISPRREYDGEATIANVKREILDLRRRCSIDAVLARSEWDLLDNHSKLDQREDFAFWSQETKLHDVIDVYSLTCSSRDKQAEMFCERILPRLQQAIRDEKAQESDGDRRRRSAVAAEVA